MPHPAHDDDACLVFSTAPDEGLARALARTLLERRLIACANLVPGLQSIYRWEGRVEESSEVLLLLKSTRGRLAELERALHELHPYDTPEFVVLDALTVAPRYLDWLRAQTL